MEDFLIIYGSKHGQTQKIAYFLYDELRRTDHTVQIFEAKRIPSHVQLTNFRSVIVGAPVYTGKYPRSIRNWIRKNSVGLAKMPTSFFSVCLGVLQKDEDVRWEEDQIVEELFYTADWFPKNHSIFAGALKYSEYGWFVKKLMKIIAYKAGGETDTSKDYEYTDWSQVRSFMWEAIKNLNFFERDHEVVPSPLVPTRIIPSQKSLAEL